MRGVVVDAEHVAARVAERSGLAMAGRRFWPVLARAAQFCCPGQGLRHIRDAGIDRGPAAACPVPSPPWMPRAAPVLTRPCPLAVSATFQPNSVV